MSTLLDRVLHPLEDDRLRRRRETKKTIAEMQVAQQRRAHIEQAIADRNRQLDEAANQHSTDAAAIQAELTKIETETTDRILAGKAPDAEADARRRQLEDQLAEINGTLETVGAKLNGEIAALNKALNEHRYEMRNRFPEQSVQTLENLLADELAEPSARCQHFGLKKGIEWATARHNSAQAKLREFIAQRDAARADLDAMKRQHPHTVDHRPREQMVASLAWRCDRWAAELKAAEQALAEAMAASDALRQKLIEE